MITANLLKTSSAIALVVAASAALLPSAASAQTWTGAVSDDYTDGRNWVGGVAPTATTNADIDTTTTAPVIDTGDNASANQLRVGPRTAGTLTVRGGGALRANGISIGGSGSLGTPGNGTMFVSGTGTSVTVVGGIAVAATANSRGVLTIESGARLSAGNADFGIVAGSVANVTVRNAGSVLDLGTGPLIMGRRGAPGVYDARLSILDGGQVLAGGIFGSALEAGTTLLVSGANSLLAPSSGLLLAGATARIDDGGTLRAASLTLTGDTRLTLDRGTLSSTAINLAGGITMNDAARIDAVNSRITVGSTITLSNNNSLTVSGSDSALTANRVVLGGASVLNIGAADGAAAAAIGSADQAFSASTFVFDNTSTASLVFNHTGRLIFRSQLGGSAGNILHRAGTTILTNTTDGGYRGQFVLTGGTLIVDGLASTVRVSGGAVLAGTGRIDRSASLLDGIIRPGGEGIGVGILSVGTLLLSPTSILDFQLGAPNAAAGVGSDLIRVSAANSVGTITGTGALTLDGTLNVTNVGGFGAGLYRLIDYTGTLTNNGLDIGAVPTGFAASDLTVQTSVARQINLVVGAPAAAGSFNFWDGANTTSNALVDGGTGTWSAGRTNWTNAAGAVNGRYSRDATLIFAGTGGVVTIDNSSAPGVDNPQVTIIDTNQFAPTGMQFASAGYRLQGGDLSFGGGASIATIRVGDGTAAGAAINATIASNLILANRIDKTDLGTLTLTGQNLMIPGGGRSRVQGGTLEIAGGGQLVTGGLEIALPGQAATFRVTGAGSVASVGIGIRTGFVNNGPSTVEVLAGGTLRDSTLGGNEFGAGSTVRVSGAGSLLDLANNSTSRGSLLVENSGLARVSPFAFTSAGSLILRSGGRIERSLGDESFGGGTWRVPNGLIQGAGSAFNTTFALSIAPATSSDPATNFIVENDGAVTVTANTDSALGFEGPLSTLIVRNGANFTLTGGTNAGLQTENARLTVDNATFAIGGVLLAGQRFGNTSIILRNADFTARSVTLNAATDSLAIGAAADEAAGGIRRFDVGTVTLVNAASTLALNHNTPEFTLASTIGGAGVIRHLAGDTRLTGDSRFFAGQTIVTGGALRVDNLFGGNGQRMTVSDGAILSGRGTIGGSVTVADGTIRPGGEPLGNGSNPQADPGNAVGTLNIGGPLVLGAASRLAMQLGAPNTPGVGSDLINVGGNLTLDGTVDITNAGGFGLGLYRLINYTDTLTDNGLLIGAVPGGFNASDLTVQTSVARQVNLIVAAPPPAFSSFSFWDGPNTAANNVIDGGTGTWTAAGRNWTVSTGEANGAYDPAQLLIFAGTGGVVTADTAAGSIAVNRGLQFANAGYRIEGGDLTLGNNAITLRVGDGTAAGAGISGTIASNLVGGASIEKTDLGTLILTGNAAPTGGTTITNGTLQIGAGGTGGSIAGDIANNGTLVFNRSGSLAYADVISGMGTLEQRGPGTLALSGVNSYTGVTTVSGGTLANSGTIVGATNVLAAGTLTNAGTIAAVTNAGTGINTRNMGALTNNGGSFTNTGTITGAVVNSAGAAFITTGTLNGNLTNSGTARIGGSINGAIDNRAGSVTATFPIRGIGAFTQSAGATFNLEGFTVFVGSLAGDGAVQLGRGDLSIGSNNANTTFAGIISGTGRIQKEGTGQLTLTGANTYSGGTTVSAGTLIGNTQSLQGAIINEGRVRFDQASAGSYAGALSGTGILEKIGVGRLEYTGIGSMSGSTLVTGGEFAINGALARSVVTVGTGARLSGGGTIGGIIAQSGSVVAPGNSVGTLTVQGNVLFAAGSTYAVEVIEGAADRITATGTAQLAGTLAITAVRGPYMFGTPYVLLSAAGGRTGTFDTTTGLAGFGAGIRSSIIYDGTTVALRLDPNALGPILGATVLTPNQRSTQQRFDAAIASGGTNPSPFFPIFNLAVGQIPTALDALSGEVHATAARLALDDERMVRRSTIDQLRSVPAGTGSGAWGTVFGSYGKIASDGNAARITRDTSGFITGADAGGTFGSEDNGWRVGVQAHHLRTTFGITDRAANGSLNRTGGGAYGSLNFGDLAIRAGAALASVRTKTARAITASGFAEQATSARKGTAFQAFGEIGYKIGDDSASFEPFAGLNLSRFKIGGITESGGVSAETVSAADYDISFAEFGLRSNMRLNNGETGVITLRSALAIRQVIGDRAHVSDIAFASSPTLNFSIASVSQDKTSFAPELGLDGDLGGGLSVNVSYTGVIGKRAEDHGIKAGLRLAF